MKAAYISQTGAPDVITYGDLPEPKPTRRQCLIKVAAVDVNPIDVYIRNGAIPAKLSFPFILGRDLAGTVVEAGAGVKGFKVGDRVWATNQGTDGRPGTFAEFAAVDHRWLHPIPEGISDEDIVSLSLVGVTAQLGLVRSANLKAGEVLFVNGGTGGVGSCVVQMAKILGARVIATAGSDQKAAACRDLGADLAINYKTQDVAAAVTGMRAFENFRGLSVTIPHKVSIIEHLDEDKARDKRHSDRERHRYRQIHLCPHPTPQLLDQPPQPRQVQQPLLIRVRIMAMATLL